MGAEATYEAGKNKFLWGLVLAWAPAIPVIIGMRNTFRGISETKATGLGAVAGGLAEAYLHPATAQLWRELLANRALSVSDLAGMSDLPVNTLRDAMNGKCPLAVGLWKEIASALHATQAEFSFTTSERNGQPCWELYCVLM